LEKKSQQVDLGVRHKFEGKYAEGRGMIREKFEDTPLRYELWTTPNQQIEPPVAMA
jgi:hypothetical protein